MTQGLTASANCREEGGNVNFLENSCPLVTLMRIAEPPRRYLLMFYPLQLRRLILSPLEESRCRPIPRLIISAFSPARQSCQQIVNFALKTDDHLLQRWRTARCSLPSLGT